MTPDAIDTDTELTVTALVPADGANTAALTARVTAAFTQELDPTTINNDALELLVGDARVSGTVEYDESTRTVTFIPAARLAPLTTYKAIISSTVKSRVGPALSGDVAWTFTTAEGQWSTPMKLGDIDHSQAPAAVRAPDGSTVALWLSNPIQTALRDSSGVWSYGATLEAYGMSHQSLDLALNASGEGIATWSAGETGSLPQHHIWAAHYVGGAWEPAQAIENLYPLNGSSQVAIASNGDAVAVWGHVNFGGESSVYSARLDHLTGWSSAIKMTSTLTAGGAVVAIDSSDIPMLAWVEEGIRVTRYINGQWEPPQLIGSGTTPRLVADANNNITAIWLDTDVHARRWDGTAWQSDTIISNQASSPATLAAASDAAGNVTVVWRQSGSSPYEVWANRFSVASGWGTPTLLASVPSAEFKLVLAVSPGGDAVAGWNACANICELYAARYIAGTGWLDAELIATDKANLELVFHGDRTPVAVWSTSVQPPTIQTSTYEYAPVDARRY